MRKHWKESSKIKLKVNNNMYRCPFKHFKERPLEPPHLLYSEYSIFLKPTSNAGSDSVDSAARPEGKARAVGVRFNQAL